MTILQCEQQLRRSTRRTVYRTDRHESVNLDLHNHHGLHARRREENRTEFNCMATRSGKSEVDVTNDRTLRSVYCRHIEANY